jgi:hypothetical protein
VRGLDKLESRAFAQCRSSIGPTIELLERFFFIFNFNDAPLSNYSLSFFFHVFCIFQNIMCIVHFEAQRLNIEHINYFHVCVGVHYLMSIVGPQGVLCAL